MIPDLDIYSTAKLLIDQHGEDASAERADALLEEKGRRCDRHSDRSAAG
jgi:hypothetical protein